jgi:hypothetical protein
MYQDKWTAGYEIRWSRPGQNAECWVVKSTSSGESGDLFRGTYDQCVAWLDERGIKQHANA